MSRQVWGLLFLVLYGCVDSPSDPDVNLTSGIDTSLTAVPDRIREPLLLSTVDHSRDFQCGDASMYLGPAIAEPYLPRAPQPFPNRFTLAEIEAIIQPLTLNMTGCGLCGGLYGYNGASTAEWAIGDVDVMVHYMATNRGECVTCFIINGQEYRRNSLHEDTLTWRRTRPRN